MTRVTQILVLALTIFVTSSARADFEYDPTWVSRGIDFSDTLQRDIMYRKIAPGAYQRSGAGSSGSTRVPKRAPRMPAVLAAQGPANQRAALERQYATMLQTYGVIATKLKLPADDVAAAYTLFVCTAYAAYHGSDLSNAAIESTARQLAGAVGENRSFRAMSTAKRQDLFEQIAIASTMLLVSFDQAKNDAAKSAEVRQLARQYLAAIADPDRFEITDQGMQLAK